MVKYMKLIMDVKYYDVVELSKMFELSENTIRNYFKDGKISAMKIGKSWHATESDIKEFLNNKTKN